MHNDTPPPRCDGNAISSSVRRRQWLQGALAVMAAGLTGSLALRVLADGPAVASLDTFMTISEALTETSNLSRVVGQRLMQALQQSSPETLESLSQLAGEIASGSLNPSRELPALKILEAWYLGVVDNKVITYEGALMFSAVSDTLVIRSYCPSGPGFWADKPIEVRS
ncbi:twin-arginine translocation pathway signal [Caballeronia sp. EK]|uniref:sugar dehydrogenase complex small subunit n=1 Tax=Caballeronia sp. EK TaxID=2767469 RepID=UPI0016550FB8|nr:sugar dehydrogenase complex small subunit [Caballeronia sp. EK]MBC8642979.1 twin-arginine translocation pathway signal [Caballeronia sp. EK]